MTYLYTSMGTTDFVGPNQPWTEASAGKMIGRETRTCPAGHERKLVRAQTIQAVRFPPTRYLTGYQIEGGRQKRYQYGRKECFLTGRAKESDRPGGVRKLEWCCPIVPAKLCRGRKQEYVCGAFAEPECVSTGKRTAATKAPIWCCPTYSISKPGPRYLTEAEQTQYSGQCEPWISPIGETKIRVPRWILKYDRTYRTDQQLLQNNRSVISGNHKLVCVLQNPTSEDIAYGRYIPPPPEEIAHERRLLTIPKEIKKIEALIKAQKLFAQGIEEVSAWYLRHKILILLVGITLTGGVGAALIQRKLKK
jgi:hypothetical protein